jgi:hypothetical protein
MTRNQNADLIKSLIANNQVLGDSLSGLGETAKEYVTDKTEKETQDFVGQLMATDSIAERDAMIKAAEGQDYLNFQTIGEKSYELGTDERALETQLAAEARAVEAEDLINTRELKEAKDATLLEHSLQKSLNAQVLEDNLYLENIQNINDTNLAQTEFDFDVDLAEKNAELLEAKLDANFKREQEDLIEKARIATEKALADSKDEQEKLRIQGEIDNALKIELKVIEKAHEENKQRQKDLREDNKDYIKEIGSIPKGLNGIFTKANGGLGMYTKDGLGFKNGDVAAYEEFRTKALKALGYKPNMKTERDQFDRWAADNITFNDNGLFGGVNDFSFMNSAGGISHIGKAFQTSDNNITQAIEAFTDSKVEIDLRNEQFSWYEKFEGGSGNIRNYHAHWGGYASSRDEGEALSAAGFKKYMYALLDKEPGK